jgi:hypothetical protein
MTIEEFAGQVDGEPKALADAHYVSRMREHLDWCEPEDDGTWALEDLLWAEGLYREEYPERAARFRAAQREVIENVL